jgi:hypothetical protein
MTMKVDRLKGFRLKVRKAEDLRSKVGVRLSKTFSLQPEPLQPIATHSIAESDAMSCDIRS